jgi:hypothetical protein
VLQIIGYFTLTSGRYGSGCTTIHYIDSSEEFYVLTSKNNLSWSFSNGTWVEEFEALGVEDAYLEAAKIYYDRTKK